MGAGSFSLMQGFAVVLAAAIIYYSKRLYGKGNFTRRDQWIWSGFAVLLILGAIIPTYLSFIFQLFTRRALDALLVFGLLASFALIFQLYVRLQQTNKDVTELVRKVAIALGKRKK